MLVEGDTNSVLGGGARGTQAGLPRRPRRGRAALVRTAPCRRRSTGSSPTTWPTDLFAPTPGARANLALGGASRRAQSTSPAIPWSTSWCASDRRARGGDAPGDFGVDAAAGYALATVHRPENVEREDAAARHLRRAGRRRPRARRLPVLAALHPRTADAAGDASAWSPAVVDPHRCRRSGYLDFLGLHGRRRRSSSPTRAASRRRPACLGVPCVTLRDNTERPESDRGRRQRPGRRRPARHRRRRRRR